MGVDGRACGRLQALELARCGHVNSLEREGVGSEFREGERERGRGRGGRM